jgi:alpha-D-ribose 1-methylphosphonate 5-phosphate C-P lyase
VTLKDLTKPWAAFNYGFLDESAKRELRRKMLKAIAVPGYQVPYASREVPMARGWGTGGLQATLTLLKPSSVVKVIDQGADDSVNACSIRKFFARVGGAVETEDTSDATIIQSRHRIPEEKLREDQILVLQVPDPEPLRAVQPDMSIARDMHGDADYGQLWLVLYEQLVKSGRIMQGSSYPSMVNGRYVMSPSPIPRWDVKKLHQADHLTILSAGREKRIYAVPPYTEVVSLDFEDHPFEIQTFDKPCALCGAENVYLDEVVLDDKGGRMYVCSDTDHCEDRREHGHHGAMLAPSKEAAE